jgi:hypothetical protein
MSVAEDARRFVPFHHAVSDDTDEYGFIKDEQEQRVRYPEHVNIKTRIYYDPRRHAARLVEGADGSSIVLTPLGTGEMNDVTK